MGWCSGTEIFDKVAKEVLATKSLSQRKQESLLATLVNALEDHDWDCQQDSAFYEHPAVQGVMKSLHPDWFEEENDLLWEDEE